MTIPTFVMNSATVSTTERSIIGNTTTGVPIANTGNMWITGTLRLANMVAGDEFRTRVYEKTNGNTAEVVYEATFIGVQPGPFVLPPILVGEGFDWTIIKVAGTDRAIAWSYRPENGEANVTQWKGTAVPTPTNAGYPLIDIAYWRGSVPSVLGSGLVQSLLMSVDSGANAGLAGAIWGRAKSSNTAADTFGELQYLQARRATAQAGAATTITLDASASATDDIYNGQLIYIASGTGAGQTRQITDYVGSTKVATVATWQTNPGSGSVFVLFPAVTAAGGGGATPAQIWDHLTADISTSGSIGKLIEDNLDAAVTTRLAPTTAGRTLDVTATGEAGIDWANIGSPTTTVNLSATTIKTATDIATDIGELPIASEIADAVWDEDLTAHTTADSAGKKLGDITEDPWMTDVSAYSEPTVGKVLTDLASGASAADIADAVWDEEQSGHTTAGTFGKYLDAQITSRLAPTTAGRTLDVTATGAAGVDLGNVENQGTTLNLSATTIKTATDVEADTADIQARLPAALVSGRMDSSVGAMAANVLTAAATAADFTTEVAAGLPSAATIADAVWDEALSGHTTGGTTGAALDAEALGYAVWTFENIPLAMYPTIAPHNGVGVVAATGTTVDVATGDMDDAAEDSYIGCILVCAHQARRITDYAPAGGGRRFTVSPAWTTTPTTSDAIQIYPAYPNVDALMPTVAGRTLDVTATGAAGIDWGNVENPTTTQGLSGTTVKDATDVLADTANIKTRIPAALDGDGNIKAGVQTLVTAALNSITAAIAAKVVTPGGQTIGGIISKLAYGIWGKRTGQNGPTLNIYNDAGTPAVAVTQAVNVDGSTADIPSVLTPL